MTTTTLSGRWHLNRMSMLYIQAMLLVAGMLYG
jgi:hypothetical protein